jgi:hypothetical protein
MVPRLCAAAGRHQDLASAYDAVVTRGLASGNPRTLHAVTIGSAWLAVAGQIMAGGTASLYDGRPSPRDLGRDADRRAP